ncbi:RNA/RNP complex-1-interacting phosphatase-like [Dendronephthya gigantea]|uniref:RNA/RNP complex-1-interacting phosphatase-like n=1 Tax=Dendronephthya gigantea TaxID=151771 RepID=UPI00106DC2A4|nr:RNA/RNP complex-1-interacting phosphatase-like [Dendronephthya gigantea]
MASIGDVRNAAKKFTLIPAKWKDYIPCGKIIANERLVPFKTPLSEKYHCTGEETHPEDCLQKNEEFTPKDLCKIFDERGNNLGLVVDFTNTKRYYDAQEFIKREIDYKKIKCEGKIIPPEKVVNRFKAAVLSFFKETPNSASVVGVHCTHGLNRAGYIVCRYLIECRGYSPKEAIEAFNKARGHKMERENYLEDLQQRKPQTLSKQDEKRLIETAPPSDDECPPESYPRRDHTDVHHRQRGNRYAPYSPSRPQHRGPRDGKRGYRTFHEDRYPAREDDRWYPEVDFVDQRIESRRVRDTPRYGDNRGHLTYDVDRYPHVDEERLPGYRERRINETDRRGELRSDRNFHRERFYPENSCEHDDYYRRHEIDQWNHTRHHDCYLSAPPRGRNDRRWEEEDYMVNYDRYHRHSRDDRYHYSRSSRYHR